VHVAVLALTIAEGTTEGSPFEPYALDADALTRLSDHLLAKKGEIFVEGVVLSTCARTEIYLEAEEFHSTVDAVSELLAEQLGVPKHELNQTARVHYGLGAAEHLYRVACGLESRILGEGEILAQVRGAYNAARTHGLSGPTLNRLFQEGIEVGKSARATTKLATGNTSVASAGARMCLESVQLESDEAPHVAVIGAGAVGREAAQILIDNGATVTVVSRRIGRANEVANDIGAKVRPLGDLLELVVECDGLIFATSSSATILTEEAFREASPRRGGRHLSVIDLSLPRDVDVALHDHSGVTLFDLDGVNRRVEAQLGIRLEAVQDVEAQIARSLSSFGSINATRELSPVLSALYQRAEEIRAREVEQFLRRHTEFDEQTKEAVARLSSQLVAKLMHAPATQLRKLVETNRGSAAIQDVKTLFDL
jgi:glutamyl-tRNA reductase